MTFDKDGMAMRRAERMAEEAATDHGQRRVELEEYADRILRAAQSLHRRWNDQRAEHIDLQTSYEELEDERDALRSSLAACRKGNDEGTALLTAMTTERDEARERLRTLAVALRDLSPGPHPGPMDAEEYLPLVREELLRLAERGGDAMDECERLRAEAERLTASLGALTSAACALQEAAGEQHPIPRNLHTAVLRAIESALDVLAATKGGV